MNPLALRTLIGAGHSLSSPFDGDFAKSYEERNSIYSLNRTCRDVYVDDTGIYIVMGSGNLFVAKLNFDGSIAAQKYHNDGPTYYFNNGAFITGDDHYIYVSGEMSQSGSPSSLKRTAILIFNKSDLSLHKAFYLSPNNTNNGQEIGMHMAVDNNILYLSGTTGDGSYHIPRVTAIDIVGNSVLWSYRFDPSVNYPHNPHGIAIDDNFVYVSFATRTLSPVSVDRMTIVKLNRSNGAVIQSKEFNDQVGSGGYNLGAGRIFEKNGFLYMAAQYGLYAGPLLIKQNTDLSQAHEYAKGYKEGLYQNVSGGYFPNNGSAISDTHIFFTGRQRTRDLTDEFEGGISDLRIAKVSLADGQVEFCKWFDLVSGSSGGDFAPSFFFADTLVVGCSTPNAMPNRNAAVVTFHETGETNLTWNDATLTEHTVTNLSTRSMIYNASGMSTSLTLYVPHMSDENMTVRNI